MEQSSGTSGGSMLGDCNGGKAGRRKWQVQRRERGRPGMNPKTTIKLKSSLETELFLCIFVLKVALKGLRHMFSQCIHKNDTFVYFFYFLNF